MSSLRLEVRYLNELMGVGTAWFVANDQDLPLVVTAFHVVGDAGDCVEHLFVVTEVSAGSIDHHHVGFRSEYSFLNVFLKAGHDSEGCNESGDAKRHSDDRYDGIEGDSVLPVFRP